MSTLKLTYFDFKARAEATRLAFVYGGIEFEDYRVGFPEWKEELKAKTTFGQLPTLHIDGQQFAQSQAILRYVGKLSKLYPDDIVEALRVDEILSHSEDLTQALTPSMRESDMDKKLQLRAELVSTTFPAMFTKLEAILGEKYAVGNKLSIADLALFVQLNWFTTSLDGVPKDLLANYPKLTAIVASVRSEEKFQEWFAKYP